MITYEMLDRLSFTQYSVKVGGSGGKLDAEAYILRELSMNSR